MLHSPGIGKFVYLIRTKEEREQININKQHIYNKLSHSYRSQTEVTQGISAIQ